MLLGGRFADLNLPPKTLWVKPCSADSGVQIKGNISNPTAPYGAINYAARPLPAQTAVPLPMPAATGLCNPYLPNNASDPHGTLDRFLWVVQYLVGSGFYVIIGARSCRYLRWRTAGLVGLLAACIVLSWPHCIEFKYVVCVLA